MHLINLLKSLGIRGSSLRMSQTSKTYFLIKLYPDILPREAQSRKRFPSRYFRTASISGVLQQAKNIISTEICYRNRQRGILAQKEHRTSQKLFVIQLASLDFMKWDDNSFKEVNMFFSERNCKPTDDRRQDIEEFSGSVKLEILVNQSVETVCDRLSDHLSSWNQLCVQSVEDILQIFSFSGFFGVHELEEFLNEDVGDISFQGFDINRVIYDKL